MDEKDSSGLSQSSGSSCGCSCLCSVSESGIVIQVSKTAKKAE